MTTGEKAKQSVYSVIKTTLFSASPLVHFYYQTSVINKLTWRTFLSASATGDTRFSGGKTGASHCTKCYIIPFRLI
jgi:hypothetical protein